MKRFLPILLVFSLAACANQKTEKKTETKKGIAKFEFQEDLHNFGDLRAGEVVSYSFKFSNVGNGDLTIEKVETDCGCIQVEFPKEVAPGESMFIEVIFNSAGEVGRVFKTITIFSNAEQNEISVSVVATVENELINLYSKN